MKSIYRFCFVLLLFVTISSVSFAGELSYEEAEEVINSYSPDSQLYTVSDSIMLMSYTDNSCVYTYYKLEPYGYAILLNETGALMEAVYEDATFLPYNNIESEYYYIGPFNYYEKINGINYDLMSNEIISDNKLDMLISYEENVITNEIRRDLKESKSILSTYSTSSVTTVEKYVQQNYFANMKKFGTNVNGTCTVLSAAILLGYYDEYVNDTYVSSVYKDGTGTTEAFHQLLNSYVYGENAQGGIFIRDALDGFNAYLDARNVSTTFKSEYGVQKAVLNKMYMLIYNNTPMIASIGSHLGSYWDHTCVVYGAIYRQGPSIDPTDSIVFRVHMGWHDYVYNTYTASGAWFYECGYIE
ncbi:MAG: hypothetical protein IJZ25_01005 [Lachnospiraceae bacterium]|nr:hypothetical protein [Lachnospiraceae bacterium]